MLSDDERTPTLREIGSRPVRVDETGRVFIGDDEFLHPIVEGSVTFGRLAKRFNTMTMTIIVGEVTMVARLPKPPTDDGWRDV